MSNKKIEQKKILLINPPWFVLQNHISTQVPMGLCYIGAVLEREGHEVLIWNADYSLDSKYISEGSSAINVEKITDHYSTYKSTLLSIDHDVWKKCTKVINFFNPDYIGISTYTSNLKSVFRLADIAKRVNKNIKILLGGPHATVLPDELITEENIDYVVVGEGETIVKSIINANENIDIITKIKGVFFKDSNNNIIKTPASSLYENVNELPFPAKHLIKDKHLMPPISFQIIYSSRGCPYNCIFCSSHKTHGKKVRFRDPKNVVDEIEYTKRLFGTYNFFFCDDTFTANINHAEAIIDEIILRKLDISWSCQTRPENITNEFAIKMKISGCKRVSIGVETGSKRIRKLIKKGNTLEDIEKGCMILKKNKIDIVGFFMFGFPTETKEEMYESVKFMKKIDPSIAHCNFATPDPGTELLTIIKTNNPITVNSLDWSDFFHQSPVMFCSDQVDENEKNKLIKELQSIFDRHNKRHFRNDIIRRMPFFIKLIYKEKLYKYPKYLLHQIRSLF